jgi:hypothetical protein
MNIIKETQPKAQRYYVCGGREQLLDFEDGLHTPEISKQIDNCKGIETGKKYFNQTQRIDSGIANWKSCVGCWETIKKFRCFPSY